MEQWKPITNYENYEISSHGRIRNYRKRILKPGVNSHGYCTVRLSNNNKSQTISVHRLVGLAYIENPNNLPIIDHIDRDKTNNKIENLRWVSVAENFRNSEFSNNATHIYHLWSVKIIHNKKRYEKTFSNYEEAVKYRDELKISLGLNI